MFRDAARYVGRCDVCQHTKVEQASSTGLMRRCVIDRPWVVVAAGVTTTKQNRYIWVIQELFTKWVECRALRAAKGDKIHEALEDLLLSQWGTSKFLLTDNGIEFMNQILQAFARETDITHTIVSPYHPQANLVERVNRVLKMITAFLDRDHREWDLHLKDFRFAYNTAHHASIARVPQPGS